MLAPVCAKERTFEVTVGVDDGEVLVNTLACCVTLGDGELVDEVVEDGFEVVVVGGDVWDEVVGIGGTVSVTVAVGVDDSVTVDVAVVVALGVTVPVVVDGVVGAVEGVVVVSVGLAVMVEVEPVVGEVVAEVVVLLVETVVVVGDGSSSVRTLQSLFQMTCPSAVQLRPG